MRKKNRILIITIALIIIFNTGQVIAATNPSYDEGYDVGYEWGAKNSDSSLSARNVYDNEYYESSEHRKIISKLGYKYIERDFRNGFLDGYDDGVDKNQAVDYASSLGRLLGEIYGARDFQNGEKSDWRDALPSDRQLRTMFNLRRFDSAYEDGFIDTFKISFEEYYIKGFDKAIFEPAKVSLEQGISDGEELGTIFGAVFGSKDYYEGKDNDYTRDLPSERTIRTEYSLNKDSDEYKNGFLSGFIRAYEEAYNKAYREANINNTLRNEQSAYSDGQEVGTIAGQMQATNDYMTKLNNDWKRSIPNDSFIINEFNLSIQTAKYRDGFISGYYDGYSSGYNERFNDLSQAAGSQKLKSEIIPISGGQVTSADGSFSIIVEPGTYFHDVNLNITTSYDASDRQYGPLIKSSDSYNISIINSSGNADDKKPLTISIEYYGDKQKGGIYRLDDYRWMYIPTTIEDGKMTAELKPSSLNQGATTYSAFVDANAMVFTDARGHWAKDEIATFVRRNVINGYSDMTFKPDRNISRAEFLTLLSRVYNWNTSYYTENLYAFKDADSFGNFSNIISYGLSHNYINGYSDGTFKPNNPITYNEVDIIMNRVIGYGSFKWIDIANDMLYEKKVRSSSFHNMNDKITRAEVVYMLYKITE